MHNIAVLCRQQTFPQNQTLRAERMLLRALISIDDRLLKQAINAGDKIIDAPRSTRFTNISCWACQLGRYHHPNHPLHSCATKDGTIAMTFQKHHKLTSLVARCCKQCEAMFLKHHFRKCALMVLEPEISHFFFYIHCTGTAIHLLPLRWHMSKSSKPPKSRPKCLAKCASETKASTLS